MKDIVIFPGGFAPFHPGHKQAYDHCVEKFKTDVYITATDSTKDRPFNFSQKQELAEISGIPKTSFRLVDTQYSPTEILKDLDLALDTTRCIFVVSEKDADRFEESRKFIPYSEEDEKSASDVCYVYVCPKYSFTIQGKEYFNASDIRDIYPNLEKSAKLKLILELYPGIDGETQFRIKKMFDHDLGTKTYKKFVTEARREFHINWGWITPSGFLLLGNDKPKVRDHAELLEYAVENKLIPSHDIKRYNDLKVKIRRELTFLDIYDAGFINWSISEDILAEKEFYAMTKYPKRLPSAQLKTLVELINKYEEIITSYSLASEKEHVVVSSKEEFLSRF